MHAIAEDLPSIPYVFISAVTTLGLSGLKDLIWKELNSGDTVIPKLQNIEKDSLIHRNLDIKSVVFEDDDENVPFQKDEEEIQDEEDDTETFDDEEYYDYKE